MENQKLKDILYIPKYNIRKSKDGLLYKKIQPLIGKICEKCKNDYPNYGVFVYLNSLEWSIKKALDYIELCSSCYKQIKKHGIKPFLHKVEPPIIILNDC
jgi:hypothetical protein